ncbi:hypothetical protein HYV69_01645 [Candidatus Uhrbacteria bacterium]|nr:hypothetical protein [Candidatus Uhrbacteria bacterium]
MMRVAVSTILFLIVFLIEISFISSLPSVFSTIPLIFALSVYLIQHQGVTDGIVWMIGYGFLIDLMHLSSTRFSTIPAIAASIVAAISAKHLFSNRSFYGVIACAVSSYLTYIIFEIFLTRAEWSIFFQTHAERLGMLIVVVVIFFSLAPSIRRIVQVMFISSHKRLY